MEDIAVTKFREYLRVNTEQPNPDYAACQNFLFNLADELGIERRAVEASDRLRQHFFSRLKKILKRAAVRR
ncbi:hypothetical protein COOONC_12139 [Cooperia oncophora]